MKHKTALITSIILTGGILAAIASSIAWFDHKTTLTPAILQGSTQGAYFGGGNGTQDTPYLIKNQRHLYNLAWLQYLGEFNQTEKDSTAIDKQYYFKRDDSLKDSGLDRKDFVLPPIGTESNPFLGNFDGNEVTINNLTVSNNFNDLNKHPYNVTSDSFNKENIQIVGFFGIVGEHNKLSYSYSSSINSVSNLYLNNVTVSTSSTNTLCGIFAGYVNGPISYCGVHYATIKVGSNVTKISSFDKVSSYTLIGDYNKDGYEWEDQPGGDVGYGTSTDIRTLYYDLGGDDTDNSTEVGSNYAFPFHRESKEIKTPSQKKASVKISPTSTNNLTISSTQQASSNNIGYYSGNGIKPIRKSRFESIEFRIPSFSTFTDPPSNVVSFLKQSVLDKSNAKTSFNFQYSIKLSASSSNLLSNSYQNPDSLTLVENSKVNSFTSTNEKRLLIPERCIWVAPKSAGTFRLVLLNLEGGICSIGLYRLKRSTPKDYSTYFTEAKLINGIQDGEPISVPSSRDSSNNKNLLAYYFELSISDSDVNAGYEYAVTTNAGSPYIAYMDIGANGGGSTTDKGEIKDLDFVTANGSTLTKLTDSDYKESNSLFSIDGTSTSDVSYFFRRVDATVFYYISNTSSGLSVSEIGSGTKKKASTQDCEN